MQRLWWIMQPKEQGVLMWETRFELEFLPQRKPTIYQPDLGQIVFANITLHCLVLASSSARWVEFPTKGNGNHSRQFRQLIKVSKVNLVYELLIDNLSWYCLKRKTSDILYYLDLNRVTPVQGECILGCKQTRIIYWNTFGQFRVCISASE